MATARFLVIDGYNREAREELTAGGAGRAGDLYVAMLGKCLPGAACDILHPADPGAKVPSFGSCWAAQMAVVAAGGMVRANPRGREMGIARKIALTPEGRGHPLYAGKGAVFDAFIS